MQVLWGENGGKMIRKAIFIGGKYSGGREIVSSPERNIEKCGDTYTMVTDPTVNETVVYVISGGITKVQQLLVSEITRLDGEIERDREYIRSLLRETDRIGVIK